MKAILIDGERRSVETIDVGSRDDIVKLIGFDTIIPVSGKAVIVGTSGNGTALRDAATDVDSVRSRIKYL